MLTYPNHRVLISLGIPRFNRTVESSKAEKAIGLIRVVATANKSYVLNNCPSNQDCYCFTTLTNDCDESGPVDQDLIDTKYIPDLNNPQRPYCYRPAKDKDGGEYVACARRRPASVAPYNSWGYAVTRTGVLCFFGTNPFSIPGAVACATLPGPPFCDCSAI